MPQLDKVTFASQVFWFFLSFFVLYLISIKWLLPSIARLLKIRKRYLNMLTENVNQSGTENMLLEKNKNFFYLESLKSSLLYLKYLDKQIINWFSYQIRQLPWKKENQKILNYIYKLSRLNIWFKK